MCSHYFLVILQAEVPIVSRKHCNLKWHGGYMFLQRKILQRRILQCFQDAYCNDSKCSSHWTTGCCTFSPNVCPTRSPHTSSQDKHTSFRRTRTPTRTHTHPHTPTRVRRKHKQHVLPQGWAQGDNDPAMPRWPLASVPHHANTMMQGISALI